MTKPLIIAITGQAGSGKTTIARYLEIEHNYVRVRFAGILKDMLQALGLTEEETDGELKDRPCSLLLGRTPRHAMQTLGTEWGRQLIHPDLWAHAWKVRVKEQLNLGHRVVCDDCRYPNEEKFVRTFQRTALWRVKRPQENSPGLMSHSSEMGFSTMHLDRVLLNHSTIEYLQTVVDQILGEG